jgi:S1-C subfamily serine protease
MLIGDRLIAFNGTALEPPMDVRPLVLAASGKVPVQVIRGGATKDLELQLPDKPVRLGISWREDAGEPGTLIIVQVVPGSAAERVGLHAGDRVYAVNGQEFGRGDRFAELVAASEDPISLTIERAGRVTAVTLPDPKTAARSMPEDESSSPSE